MRLPSRLIAPAALCAVTACTPAPTTEEPAVTTPWFTEAALEPGFAHANAVWAGVALFDYDADGWLDIFFTNGRSMPDALYRNMGDGRFVDVAAAAGVDSRLGSGSVVSGDLDNDGDEDLVVSGACSTGTLTENGGGLCDGFKTRYLNNGDGTFTSSDIPSVPCGGVLCDTTCCTVSVSLSDMNLDGALDLVVTNGGDPDVDTPWQFRKNRQNGIHNFVLVNDGAGNFDTAYPRSSDYESISKISFVTATLDVSGDGLPDQLVGEAGFPMDIFVQEEGEQLVLRDESYSSGDGLWMGLAVADYDGDGDQDVYGTNQGLSTLIAGYDDTAQLPGKIPGEWINISHSLLLFDGERFEPATDWEVDAPQVLAGDLFDGTELDREDLEDPENLARYPWGWGVVPLDVDEDGWVDVAYTGNNCSMPLDVIWTEDRGAGPGAVLRNVDGQGFQDVTWELGVANVDGEGRYQDGRGIAVGDLNNDGYPDLVYANRNYNPTLSDPLAQVEGTPHVWLSHPSVTNHWLKIRLVGTQSNRDGAGSTVVVTAEGRDRVFVTGTGGNTASSSERLLLVGLGGAEEADVRVTFPSGVVVTSDGVAADQLVTVEEG